MREQKKEPTPAKGLTRIGNQRSTSCHKLQNDETLNNAISDGRSMAILLKTMKSGLSSYVIIFHDLAEKYTPFYITDFRKSFFAELKEAYYE